MLPSDQDLLTLAAWLDDMLERGAIGAFTSHLRSLTAVVTSLTATIGTPVLTLTSGNLVYPPTFSVALDDTVQVGDTLNFQYANDNGFSSGLVTTKHVITSGEAVAKAVNLSLVAIVSGTHRYEARIERANLFTAWSNIVTQGPPPPTLSLPTATAPSSTTATLGVTTDTAAGILYTVLTTSLTAPTAAQIKTGKDNGGAAATYASSQSIASTGVKTFAATGLTALTVYYAWFMQEDAALQQSNVPASASVTPGASVAVLFAGAAGVNRNQYIDVTGGGFIATMNNAPFAPGPVRSTNTMPTKAHFEVTINTISNALWFGVVDSSVALGANVNPIPGNGSAAGFSLRLLPATTANLAYFNNTNTAATTTAPVAGHIFSFDVDNVANTVLVKQKVGGTTTTVGTYTLTSLIPTTWTAFVAGQNTNESMTANFGGTAFAVTPATGFGGW